MTSPSKTPKTLGQTHTLWRLVALVTAWVCLGFAGESNCENQDIGAIQVLVMDGKAGSTVEGATVNTYEGAQLLDFVVTNEGRDPLEIELRATTRSTTVRTEVDAGQDTDTTDADTGDGNADAGDPNTEAPIPGVTRLLTIPVGASITGRISEQELDIGYGLDLVVTCISSICIGKVEYTVLLRQHECRSDSQCDSDQICDQSQGRCTGRPCDVSGSCPTDLTCDRRLDPPRCVTNGVFGCTTAPMSPRPVSPAWALLLILVAVWTRRRSSSD